MDKKLLVLAALLFSAAIPAAADAKKEIIIFIEAGAKGFPTETLDALARHPKVKLAVVWPSSIAPGDKLKGLSQAGSIEAVPFAENEPIFPLIFETFISTPVKVEFRWPEDAAQIIFRAQQAHIKAWNAPSSGFFLESGEASQPLLAELGKMNVAWAAAGALPSPGGAFNAGGFTLFAPRVYDFASLDEYWQWVSSAPAGSPACVWIKKPQQLTAAFVNALAQRLETPGAPDAVLPTAAAAGGGALQPVEAGELEYDLQPWLRNPAIWQRLGQARQDIEAYKNSGMAGVDTLEAAKDEIFDLYDQELLRRLNANPGGEQEQRFIAGLSNIYRLIKKNMPPEMSEPLTSQLSRAESQSFQTVASRDGLVFFNSIDESQALAISRFDISYSTKSVVFEITLSTQSQDTQPVIDIYIDMNNKQGAGLAQLLQGVNAFMKPQDAWEFALRMDSDWLYIYRSGRFVPSLLKKEKLLKKYRAEIPASILRGNPAQWGYQAVLSSVSWQKPAAGAAADTRVLKVEDFLCPENVRREKLLERAPVQLPAQRINR